MLKILLSGGRDSQSLTTRESASTDSSESWICYRFLDDEFHRFDQRRAKDIASALAQQQLHHCQFEINGSFQSDRVDPRDMQSLRLLVFASSQRSYLDRVSTGSGSDLVSDQYAISPMILTPLIDQVASAPCTDPIQARLLLTQSYSVYIPDRAAQLPVVLRSFDCSRLRARRSRSRN